MGYLLILGHLKSGIRTRTATVEDEIAHYQGHNHGPVFVVSMKTSAAVWDWLQQWEGLIGKCCNLWKGCWDTHDQLNYQRQHSLEIARGPVYIDTAGGRCCKTFVAVFQVPVNFTYTIGQW